MLPILTMLMEICQFKKNPQDLPSSQFLKLLLIGTYLVVGMIVSTIHQPFNTAIVSVIIDTGLMIALAYAGLWVRGFEGRTTQTIIALAGTGTLFGIIGAPLMLLLPEQSSDQLSVISFLLLSLVVWNISVIGHILRHTLTIPFWAGFGISVFYFYTSIRVMSLLAVAGQS